MYVKLIKIYKYNLYFYNDIFCDHDNKFIITSWPSVE